MDVMTSSILKEISIWTLPKTTTQQEEVTSDELKGGLDI